MRKGATQYITADTAPVWRHVQELGFFNLFQPACVRDQFRNGFSRQPGRNTHLDSPLLCKGHLNVMNQPFADRHEAGAELATKLGHFANRDDVVVLALPRGGVPVAFEVAEALDVPPDIFLVRKLGMPGYPELAMGAIASGSVRVLNEDVVRWYGNLIAQLRRLRSTSSASSSAASASIGTGDRRSTSKRKSRFLSTMDWQQAPQ